MSGALLALVAIFGAAGALGAVPSITWTAAGPLVAAGTGQGEGQGNAITLSGLGTTLAVGGSKGTIRVYVRVASQWIQQAQFSIGKTVVKSLALSHSGDNLASFTPEKVSVHVRDTRKKTWSLEGAQTVGTSYGYIAISGDGGTVATDGDEQVAIVYTRVKAGANPPRWVLQGEVKCGPLERPLALDFSGNTLACPYDKWPYGTYYGMVYQRSAKGVWPTVVETLDSVKASPGVTVLPTGRNDVALSADGNTLAFQVETALGPERLYIYTRQKNAWILRQSLPAPSRPVGISASIKLSSDGSVLSVANAKSVFVYIRNAKSSWVWTAPELVGKGKQGIAFAATLSMDAAGKVIVIGDPAYNKGQGATWSFTRK